ncbi:MAG: xanthine dehydrogenase family protein molybdopterin-binding subunit [Acidobacteriota bacterium]|nr:xanthine dehydrogenase family protein molybdopterin-binding subunit [Acidobacteriota bacterium]
MPSNTGQTRREFVRNAGGLLVGFSLLDASIVPQAFAGTAAAGAAASGAASPSPAALDAWLHIDTSGRVHVSTGKVEIGMGVETALAQIVAEELDVPVGHVLFVMGDTSRTPDQGGVGGSTSISNGARPLRNAAASARALLLQAASRQLGVPADALEVRDGIVRVRGRAHAQVSYGALTGGDALQETLKVSGAGFSLNVQGMGTPKDPSAYRIVGQPVPRVDLAPKVLGRFRYITDVRVPGMLHGRVIRPAGVGAHVVGIDETAAKAIAGYVRAVVKGDFVGVVADTEWAAIRAARALTVTWSAPAAPFPGHDQLYAHMRTAEPKASRETLAHGDVAAALAAAARRVEAVYEFPFQSHATMGPGCAVADVQPDGITTVWSGVQKPHALQRGLAGLLGVPVDRMRVVWVEDAGSYGRPGFADAAADALLLSQAVGRPVRVQWMRDDMTAWGTKGPAVRCELAAALDASGHVTAVRFESRAFSGGEVLYQPSDADNFLAAALTGMPNRSGVNEFVAWGSQTPAYAFTNVQATAHVIAPFHDGASPLRSSHLRDPEGPAASFAVESFIDELAVAASADPIAFRLQYLTEPRAKAVLTAAAEKAGWQARTMHRPAAGAEVATGRGVALGTRNGTYVGTIADVAVNRRTGAVKVTRFVCAHDCGLVVNPMALRRTIEANLVQSMSRALFEEVQFDRSRVTSVDWNTYPVARAADIPPVVEVVLLDHPDLPPGGAGEPSSRPTAAAIANAVFDAVGVRVRQAPLTPARVKAALEQA